MRSLIATVVFLIISVFVSIVSIPAAVFDRSGRTYLKLARFWSRLFLILYGIKVTVTGTQNVKHGVPTVYVSNHSSYVDVPAVIASVPDDIRLIFRDSLLRIPIWGWALRYSPFLMVSRENASKAKSTFDNATSTIRRGTAVLLFPEGTRSSDGRMQSFKRGAFKIALDSEAVVVPIAIKGTFEILPRSKRIPKSGRVSILIGKPIPLPLERGRAAELELMRRTEEAMLEMISEAPAGA